MRSSVIISAAQCTYRKIGVWRNGCCSKSRFLFSFNLLFRFYLNKVWHRWWLDPVGHVVWACLGRSQPPTQTRECWNYKMFISGKEHHLKHNHTINQSIDWNSISAKPTSVSESRIHTHWFIITGPPSFHRHNLMNMQFVYTKLCRLQREIMLCEVLSEFPKYVLPLPCNICINVTSWDGLINV